MTHTATIPWIAAIALVAALPDILPDHLEGIRVEAHLHLGPLESRVCRQVAIAQGDTFPALAQRWLGTVARADEITALNPGVDPKKLVVGSLVWLPPTDPKAGDGAPFAFTTLKTGRNTFAAALRVDDDTVGATLQGTFSVVLVPPALRVRVEGAIAKPTRGAIDEAIDHEDITRIATWCLGSLVPRGADLSRRIDDYRVAEKKPATAATGEPAKPEKKDAPAFTLEVDSKWFDRKGKPRATPSADEIDTRDPSDKPKPKGGDKGPGREAEVLLLLLAAATGAGALALRTLRRQPAPAR